MRLNNIEILCNTPKCVVKHTLRRRGKESIQSWKHWFTSFEPVLYFGGINKNRQRGERLLTRFRFGNFTCKKLSKTSLLANSSCIRRFFSSLMASSGVSSDENNDLDSRRWENQRRSVFEGECIYWSNYHSKWTKERIRYHGRNLTS